MTVKKLPETFVACDGQEFASEDEAERHDALASAVRCYEQAQNSLNNAMASTIKTADGQSFDVRRWSDYWFVSCRGAFGPALARVAVGYDTALRLPSGYQTERVEVLKSYRDNHGCQHETAYNVAELYSDEREATKALIVAIEQHIAKNQAAVTKLREKNNLE